MNKEHWTGERLETFIDNEVAIEHLHRYAIVLSIAADKKVLDVASGEGYGSHLISKLAKQVTGVDIDSLAVAKAQQRYKASNLTFIEGSASKIPIANASVDVVASFETLEHHDKHDEMLSEIKRVLMPEGVLIISSPDKLEYTDNRNYVNSYHVKELYKEEFKLLIERNFTNVKFFYQRSTFASLLIPENGQSSFTEYEGDYNTITSKQTFRPLYIIAVASDGPLPQINLSVFTDDNMIGRLTAATVEKVRSTVSYKIGHRLSWPLKALKGLVKSK